MKGGICAKNDKRNFLLWVMKGKKAGKGEEGKKIKTKAQTG
jgi:hypothetical protein